MGVLPGSLIEYIMIRMIFFVTIRGHGPDGILEAHWRTLVGDRVEGMRISSRMDDRNKMLLTLEEYIMTADVSRQVQRE
jgi:hypothetical protein